MSSFIFRNGGRGEAAHWGEVPAGITSKGVLLDAISAALRFPEYFGGNWDALEECIRDLSWLPGGDVVLGHRDVPLSEDAGSLATYLLILTDAVKGWESTGRRRLFVVFPPGAESVVERVLADAGKPNDGAAPRVPRLR